MAKKTEKLIYALIILRKDGDHINVMEDSNYEKCYERWETLHTEWSTCSKEIRPFILKDPIVTAFEPILISEIAIRPLLPESVINSDNPYQKKMMQSGLSGMQNSDLLSRIGTERY